MLRSSVDEKSALGRHVRIEVCLRYLIPVIAVIAVVLNVCIRSGLSFADEPPHTIGIEISEIGEADRNISLGERTDRRFFVDVVAGECLVKIKPELTCADFGGVVCYSQPEENDWICGKDGWWYWRYPVLSGGQVIFSTGFRIEGDEPFLSMARRSFEGGQEKSLSIEETVVAEAVQYTGLDPDWGSDDPWESLTSDPHIKTESAVLGSTGNGTAGTLSASASSSETDRGSTLAKTGDMDPILEVSVLSALLALVILFFDVAYHRKKCRQEMIESEKKASISNIYRIPYKTQKEVHR